MDATTLAEALAKLRREADADGLDFFRALDVSYGIYLHEKAAARGPVKRPGVMEGCGDLACPDCYVVAEVPA